MSDQWLRPIRLPLSREQFQALPRSPVYHYVHRDGEAWINPRPRYYHAVLDLDPAPGFDGVDRELRIDPLEADDWVALGRIFVESFASVPPFGHLDETERALAAEDCLVHTRSGRDGPLLPSACFVARQSESETCGAILVTLMPDGDPAEASSYHWPAEPPADVVPRRLGRPHLTWIFVAPVRARRGVATTLLQAAVDELRRVGYRELASTFLLGNEPSLLWHWRNGFRLCGYEFSRRRWKDPLSGSSK
jgi:GNAT superfamily N-acetyltransferase